MGQREQPRAEQLQAGAWFENNAYYISGPALKRLGLTLLICTELRTLACASPV